MSILSSDARPRFYVIRTRTAHLFFVPRQNWAKYAPGELLMTIDYKVPVLGNGLDAQFTIHKLQTSDLEYGYKFYHQKLASYQARRDAQRQRLREQKEHLI